MAPHKHRLERSGGGSGVVYYDLWLHWCLFSFFPTQQRRTGRRARPGCVVCEAVTRAQRPSPQHSAHRRPYLTYTPP